MLKEDTLSWSRPPRWADDQKPPHIVLNKDGEPVAQVEGDKVTLLPGYAWNGPDKIPDTRSRMRASAYHDLFIQLAKGGTYKNCVSDYRRAASEYVRILKEDGEGFFSRTAQRLVLWAWAIKTRQVVLLIGWSADVVVVDRKTVIGLRK